MRARRLVMTAVAAVITAVVVMAAVAVPPVAARDAPASQTPPPGGVGLRLVDVPADAVSDPRARLYIIDHVAPGTVMDRRIEVSNTTDAAAEISLYAAAATIEDGAFVGADGRGVNDVSSWISITPAASEVAAAGRLTAELTVAVPADAASGEHYAVVWAEVRTTPEAVGGITQVNRVGIRVYLSVGPGGPPAADFTIDSLTASRSTDGRPTIVATVHNSGGRALDISGTLQLVAGPGGLSAGPFPADLGVTLAIGATESVTVLLDERLPAGPWEARVALHSGLLEREARASITFPASGVGAAVPTHTPRNNDRLLVLGSLGSVLVLVLIVGLTTRRRRRPDLVRVRTTATG